jgi:hypothetical protein
MSGHTWAIEGAENPVYLCPELRVEEEDSRDRSGGKI